MRKRVIKTLALMLMVYVASGMMLVALATLQREDIDAAERLFVVGITGLYLSWGLSLARDVLKIPST